MSDESAESPLAFSRRLLRSGWNTLLTVYYANSVSWRLLKAGALVFLGFFAWAGSSILLSYRPGITILDYLRAYGFVLIGYGPFHHLVVIPIYQRLRRQGTHLSLGGHLHLPNLSLAVFLIVVVLLGTFPAAAGPMTIDFTSALDSSGVDVDPALLCVKGTHENGTDVHCHLSESRGIDRLVVRSGGKEILTDDEPPFDFTVRDDQLAGTSKRFVVDLIDAKGNLIRRYTRTLSMIDAG